MALDPRLLEILACPDDKGPLYYFPGEGGVPGEPGEGGVPGEPGEGGVPGESGDSFLVCPACRRRYEVRDDIPVMLIDEAVILSEDEVAGLVERAGREGIAPTFSAEA